MASKPAGVSYVVDRPFDRVDAGKNKSFKVGDPYAGDDVELYLEIGLIVPASAGSNQPGNDDGSAAK
ncbi:MAG: hypothetical protein JWO11_3497 [Nocardioides sp.]|nr:hypothetical protein [Nocardioides sp.]